MSGVQFAITIAMCTAATMLTRFLPFLIFSSKDQQPPEVVRYLGKVLPAAIFGMLIVYCLKGGGEVNTERCAIMLVDEFRACKWGRISLERPPQRDDLADFAEEDEE